MIKILSLFCVVSYFCFLESSVALSQDFPWLLHSQTGRRVRRDVDCTSNGQFPDRPPEMCSVMYFSCSNAAGKWEKRWFSCARGEHYDPSSPSMCAPGPCLKKAKQAGSPGTKDAPPDTPPPEESEEITTTTTEATTTMPPLRPLGDSDLHFSPYKLSWDKAMSYCAKAKAALLVIEDEEDNLFINSPESVKRASYIEKESVWSAAKFANTEYEKLFWEPEHEKIENFRKKKSMNLKINWGRGEPSDESESGEELCVDMKFSGGKNPPVWAASDCKEEKYFICIRKEEDRRYPKSFEDPIEEPIYGFPGSLTIHRVNGDPDKGVKLTGQLLRSNRSDYYYFYPDKRRLVPSPLLNEDDDPYNATYKPTKSILPSRAIDTLSIKTNGSVLPMSNNRMIIFVQEGKYAQGVFQPDSGAMHVTAVVSAMDGELLLTPEGAIEFLAYDWHEAFTGPTPGKWRPEKIFEYADKPWAKAGHGVMKPLTDGQILWLPDDPVEIPKKYDPQ